MSNDTSVDNLLLSINDIYETLNIFQSIIIVDDVNADSLYNDLIDLEFPIVTYADEDDVQDFIKCNKRVLLVTMAEIEHFVKRYTEICNNVTVIISTTTAFDDDYITDLHLPSHVNVIFA
jgi:hypothetical protein